MLTKLNTKIQVVMSDSLSTTFFISNSSEFVASGVEVKIDVGDSDGNTYGLYITDDVLLSQYASALFFYVEGINTSCDGWDGSFFNSDNPVLPVLYIPSNSKSLRPIFDICDFDVTYDRKTGLLYLTCVKKVRDSSIDDETDLLSLSFESALSSTGENSSWSQGKPVVFSARGRFTNCTITDGTNTLNLCMPIFEELIAVRFSRFDSYDFLVKARVTEEGDDWLLCDIIDYNNEGDSESFHNIPVAKPSILRRTMYDGYHRDFFGSYSYVDEHTRTVLRANSSPYQNWYFGFEVTETIFPSYQIADVIYIMKTFSIYTGSYGTVETGVEYPSSGSGDIIKWEDVNVDGRAWAMSEFPEDYWG